MAFAALPAHAAVICTPPPVCVATSGGTVGQGGDIAISPLISFQPGYDTLRFNVPSDFKIWVESDVRKGQLPHLIWQNVEIGDSSLPYVNAQILGSDFANGVTSGLDRILEVQQLSIENASVSTEVKLLFDGPANRIELNDNTLRFTDQRPAISMAAPCAFGGAFCGLILVSSASETPER